MKALSQGCDHRWHTGTDVHASLAKEPEEVIDEAFLDAASRDPKRRKPWVVLLDGHADQLARVRAAARRHRVTVKIGLDLIHVLEYLWKAPTSSARRVRAMRKDG